MNVRVPLLLVVIVLAVMSTSLSAHHSAVAYLQQSIVLKNATITKVVWAHPHIILAFTVKDAKGAVSNWSVESGSPGSAARLGLASQFPEIGGCSDDRALSGKERCQGRSSQKGHLPRWPRAVGHSVKPRESQEVSRLIRRDCPGCRRLHRSRWAPWNCARQERPSSDGKGFQSVSDRSCRLRHHPHG